MAWVRFQRAFDFVPSARPRVLIAYPPGLFNVTRECAAAAVAAGAAEPAQPLKRGSDAPAEAPASAPEVSAPVDDDR